MSGYASDQRSQHAQTEVIGSILLAGIVIISAVTFGAFFLDTVQDETENTGATAQISGSVTTDRVTLSHNGGESVDISDLRVTITVNGTDTGVGWTSEWTGDRTFDPGETWRYSFSPKTHPDAVVTVRLVDTETNRLLFEDERNPDRSEAARVVTAVATGDGGEIGGGGSGDGSPSVQVQAPNGDEDIQEGSTYEISWTASDSETSVETIDIEYSTDSGSSWTTLATGETHDGSYNWDTTGVGTTSNALVRVTATDTDGNTAMDRSDATFRIDGTTPSIIINDPNGGETFQSGDTVFVSWTASDTGSGIDKYDVDYSMDTGSSWMDIDTESNGGASTYSWATPDIDSSEVLVRVRAVDAAGNADSDASDETFTIEGSGGSESPPDNSGYNDANGNGQYDSEETTYTKAEIEDGFDDTNVDLVLPSALGTLDIGDNEINAKSITLQAEIANSGKQVNLRADDDIDISGAVSTTGKRIDIRAGQDGSGELIATGATLVTNQDIVLKSSGDMYLNDSTLRAGKNKELSADLREGSATLYVEGAVIENSGNEKGRPLEYAPSEITVDGTPASGSVQ